MVFDLVVAIVSQMVEEDLPFAAARQRLLRSTGDTSQSIRLIENNLAAFRVEPEGDVN